MKPSSCKQKGRSFQQAIVARILHYFPILEPDDVLSRGMGGGGEDIMLSPAARKLMPISIEAKNQEKLSLWASWKQCKANAGKYEPVLMIKKNREKPLAVIDLEHYLTLLKGREIILVPHEVIK